MKTLWNIVSFLAVVHLLALAGFVAWLWSSDRLSVDRIHAIRETLAITITQEEDVAAEAEALALKQQQEALDEAMLRNPPLTSAAQIELVSRIQEQADQATRRMQQEHQRLMTRLDDEQVELARREAEFEAQKAAWIEAESAAQERKVSEQFAQVVKLLESIPAKLAKEKIRELVNSDNTDQAVAYLDAMNSRAAAGIIKEFKTPDEHRLATELLERLRTFGVPESAAASTQPGPPRDVKKDASDGSSNSEPA